MSAGDVVYMLPSGFATPVQPQDLPVLRACLAPQYATLSAAQLDALLRQALGTEVSAEDVEGFFDDVGRAFSSATKSVGRAVAKAAPAVLRAAPAVLSGIAQGASAGSVAGPYGAIIGGLIGGAGAGLKAGSRPGSTVNQIGSAIGGITSLAGAVTGRGGAASLLGGGGGAGVSSLLSGGGAGGASPLSGVIGSLGSLLGGTGRQGSAVGQLLSYANRPEVQQALMSTMLGSAGRASVPVTTASGTTNIPTALFGQLLQYLTNRASAEYALQERISDESADWPNGSEAALEEARAEALMELLDEAAEYRAQMYADEDENWAAQKMREDEYYDELELAYHYGDYLGEDVYEADEYDEYDEVYGEYDEYDEADEYDESLSYAYA